MGLHEKMNEYLANLQISYIKLHNLHWYVKGKGFFTLHSKFEELYDQTADMIDDVAERMLAIGVKPVANVKKALELARVKELDDKKISGDDAIKALYSDVEYWVNDSRDLAQMADNEGDDVTGDMFREYQKEYEKLLWMLKAYQG